MGENLRTVVVDWSYPIEVDRILTDARMDDVGLYYITRDFGGNISDLYIGKTTYSFKSRLESHRWNWLDQYRGEKKVRLGYLISPKTISLDRKKNLINDIEMTLIFLMRDSLLQNRQCTSSCCPSERLNIVNINYRGNLAEEMCISDEDWKLNCQG